MFAYIVRYTCNECGITTERTGGRLGLDQPSASGMLPEGWHRPFQSYRQQHAVGGPRLCPDCAPIGKAWDERLRAWRLAYCEAVASLGGPVPWAPSTWLAIKPSLDAWVLANPPPDRPTLRLGWSATAWCPPPARS